jgi:hypothetical protein
MSVIELTATEREGITNNIRSLAEPRSLEWLLDVVATYAGRRRTLAVDDFLNWLASVGPNDRQRGYFHAALAKWDSTPDQEWSEGTRASTPERRARIFALMQLSAAQQDILARIMPQNPCVGEPVVIGSTEWRRWYTEDRRNDSFYWDSYRGYLIEQRKWNPKNIAALDNASTDVVERLVDPLGKALRPSKGLVVGYVQSGKTANFTGVIAKAVDAGYRLVIVLAGMQNVLRDQTQRRLDKELLGQEFVRADYGTAADWEDFVSHGGLPSHQQSFDWVRLTSATQDFREVRRGLTDLSLRFSRTDPSKPFRCAENIFSQQARLAVVKKNQQSLKALLAALNAEGVEQHVLLEEVPTLIIDDESDQASVNTARPTASATRQRKTINGLIVKLLSRLKNAQYVGYTATPFANVFIDPNDEVDLFPSDFILSLPRPVDYMGVQDFTDTQLAATDPRSNRWAHVREIKGDDDKEENLTRAIDAFVLSGAIKVFRERHGLPRFRHHTMLVHSSTRTDVHKADARKAKRIFLAANYIGLGPGEARLKALWEVEYRAVCEQRANGAPTPGSWEEIRECLADAHQRITQNNGEPVLILNGTDKDAAPDFDSEGIWRIIVGGAKLSRGYTVEGLTISYYRRTAQAVDTLMQMGRWFGFRVNYKDLVRLYIGVDEARGVGGERMNLYAAFEAACRDEEGFRDQLRHYASLEEGERITPKQVPPLVPVHLLPPTSSDKMFNARQAFVNYGGRTVERTTAPRDTPDRQRNIQLLREMLANTRTEEVSVSLLVDEGPQSFISIAASPDCGAVLRFLKSYRWQQGYQRDWNLVTEFIEGRRGDPGIASWLILAPQLERETNGSLEINGVKLRIKVRNRAEPTRNRYLVFTESKHVFVAKWGAGISSGAPQNPLTAGLKRDRQAVMLLYPVISEAEQLQRMEPSVGFSLYFPQNHIRSQVVFEVANPNRPDDLVVASGI